MKGTSLLAALKQPMKCPQSSRFVHPLNPNTRDAATLMGARTCSRRASIVSRLWRSSAMRRSTASLPPRSCIGVCHAPGPAGLPRHHVHACSSRARSPLLLLLAFGARLGGGRLPLVRAPYGRVAAAPEVVLPALCCQPAPGSMFSLRWCAPMHTSCMSMNASCKWLATSVCTPQPRAHACQSCRSRVQSGRRAHLL